MRSAPALFSISEDIREELRHKMKFENLKESNYLRERAW
jgi:hypothetical protein